MTISSFSAAKMICERSGWEITNLELQKILYMAHMVHMGRTAGERLVDTTFEAWDYGPVDPRLYARVRMFGSDPVEDVFFRDAAPDAGTPEHANLDEACNALIGRSSGDLVAMTHWKDGAWAKVYQPGVRHISIPDDLILEEFRARVVRARDSGKAA